MRCRARNCGRVTEPSPPMVSVRTPRPAISRSAASMTSKEGSMRPGVTFASPQSTTPSAVSGLKSKPGGR